MAICGLCGMNDYLLETVEASAKLAEKIEILERENAVLKKLLARARAAISKHAFEMNKIGYQSAINAELYRLLRAEFGFFLDEEDAEI